MAAAVAMAAAGAVMLATITVVPPNPPSAVSAPQISTQAVRLAVQPVPLNVAPVADAVSIPSVNVGGAIQRAIGQVIAGAGRAAFSASSRPGLWPPACSTRSL